MKTDTNDDVRIFIGYDPAEIDAFHVLCCSIWQNASRPVSITPIQLSQLRPFFQRQRHPLQSTEFSISRFLTPWLSKYRGWSLFLDCDMLVLGDIWELLDLRDPEYAVMCTKHNHEPKEDTKMLGQVQTAYPRKNWSSVMLFNNPRCKILDLEVVSNAEPLFLHRFKWVEDKFIGGLPLKWNHLVGYQNPDQYAKNVHFTLGIPRWKGYENCEFAKEWRITKDVMNAVLPISRFPSKR